MMRPSEEIEVYLYRGIVDMRKSINGLSAIVEQELGLSPFSPRLFVDLLLQNIDPAELRRPEI